MVERNAYMFLKNRLINNIDIILLNLTHQNQII